MVAVLSIFGVSSILGNDKDFGDECTRDAKEKSVCAFDTMAKQKSEEKKKTRKNCTANTATFVFVVWFGHAACKCWSIWHLWRYLSGKQNNTDTHTYTHYAVQLDILCSSLSLFLSLLFDSQFFTIFLFCVELRCNVANNLTFRFGRLSLEFISVYSRWMFRVYELRWIRPK